MAKQILQHFPRLPFQKCTPLTAGSNQCDQMATLFVQHSSIYNNEKKTNFGSKFCLIILKKLSNTKPGQNFTKFAQICRNFAKSGRTASVRR